MRHYHYDTLIQHCAKIMRHYDTLIKHHTSLNFQASLASAPNKEVNDFIIEELRDDLPNGNINRLGIFIGATDKTSEGNWKWTDGSCWGYENWYGDNGHAADADCGEIVVNVGNSRHLKKEYWNDVPCHKENLFLCSKPIQ